MSKTDVIRVFSGFDTNGSGTIDEYELQTVLKSISDLTSDDVKQLFMAFDSSKDGKIQMDEFLNFVFDDLSLSFRALPARLKTAMKAAFDRLVAENYKTPQDSVFESKVELEGATIKELRARYKLENIPDSLETKVIYFHLKHTPMTSGDHNLKLARLAPYSGDRSHAILCLLHDVGRNGVDKFLYSLQDGKLNNIEGGVQLMTDAEARLPRNVKLWCCLCVGAGGRDKCMFSNAITTLTNSDLLSSSEVITLAETIRSQKDFTTLTEFILQLSSELGVDESDPEMQRMLKRAAEQPKEVIGELSRGFGMDVSAFVTEPELDIDWILSQLPPVD